MAHDGGVGRARVVAELFVINRLRAPLRAAVPIAVGVACVVAGALALNVQQHFASQPGQGRLSALLANGSTGATAWEGWAAAVLFLGALLRLRQGTPEPPAGRASVESLTTAQLRAGLVREYAAAHVGLLVLAAFSVVEASRSLRYVVAAATGDGLARGSLLATLIESAGVIAATTVLAAWVLTFRGQLERIGVLRPPSPPVA